MTVELRVDVPDHLADMLVAELAEFGFVAFAREGRTSVAWGPAEAVHRDTLQAIGDWVRQHAPSSTVETVELPDTNWNAAWEASITPIAAGPFVVLPSWAEVPESLIERVPLRIDPKMSFGTGHHASTRLALTLLPGVVRPGLSVLDVGCGTGVLAIGALKLGAGRAIGCDIDEWSAPNALECAALNGLAESFEVRQGGLEVIPETEFDLVLANIIRSTLVEMMPALARRMNRRGCLVLAGLLESEREQMVDAATAAGLEPVDEARDDGWWAGSFVYERPDGMGPGGK